MVGVHLSPVSALVSHDPSAVALTASLLGLVFSWGFMDINIHCNEYRQLVLQIKLSVMKQTTQL